MKTHLLLLLLLCWVLSGRCQDNQQFSEFKDLAYVSSGDASPYEKLNLVLPKNKKDFPLLLWIGGGAWSYVDRNMEMDFARKMAREGIAVASVGHRLSPATWKDPSMTTGIKHPEHIKDVAQAFQWLIAHASKYGYAPSKIFVAGYSSGAHLTALLAMDHRYLENVGCSVSQIRAIIPMSGTYDIPHYYEVLASSDPKLADDHVKGVFGSSREEFLNASPSSYLHGLQVPMLLISDKDLVKYTRFFEAKLQETDFKDFNVIYVEDLGHGGLWKDISFAEHSKHRDAVVAFIRKHS
jgi:dipeptidyl aminopeptidase/acylaminoacyl peptidase